MKKRTLWLGSTALLAVLLLGAGLADAKGPNGDHGQSAQSHGAAAQVCVVSTATSTTSSTTTSTTATTTTTTTTSTTATSTTSTTSTTSSTATSSTSTGAPAKVAQFGAKVTPGHPCGTIVVQAKVLHPVRGKTFSATATAKFAGAGGPVTITLRRAGKSYVAIGKIRVPADQAAGPVDVEITIVYGGVTQPVIHKTSQIKAP